MPSKTENCKMALAHVGITPILRNVDTDNTKESRTCLLFYDQCVNSLLELRPWQFAKREAPLVLSSQTPPDQWGYLYVVPATCARINRIVNPRTRSPNASIPPVVFDVISLDDGSGTGILTDEADAILEYNHRNIAPERQPYIFSTALSLMLATFIANPLRANADIAKFVQNQWAVWLNEAVAQTQNDRQDDPEPNSEAVTGRG